MNYETPGVYVEEISGGPRPVAASPTTDTALVAVISLPTGFHVGGEKGSYKRLIPTATSDDAQASWARELAFRGLEPAKAGDAQFLLEGKQVSATDVAGKLPKADPKKKDVYKFGGAGFPDAKTLVSKLGEANSGQHKVEVGPAGKPGGTASVNIEVRQPKDIPPTLNELIEQSLGKGWTATGSAGGDQVQVLISNGEIDFDVALAQSMLVHRGEGEWALANANLRSKIISQIGTEAIASGIGATAPFAGAETEVGGNLLGAVQEAMVSVTSPLTSLDAFLEWRDSVADQLYIELAHAFSGTPKKSVAAAWKSPKAGALRAAWIAWMKSNPGMVRLDVSVRGFFANGGSTAYPSIYLSAGGSSPMGKGEFLGHAYDDFSRVAMVTAPGLSADWQSAILDYCGPKGRGDLFAVMDTPRYFLTQPSAQTDRDRVGSKRWSDAYKPGDDPNYEIQSLQTVGGAEIQELRFRKLDDTLLSTVVARDDAGHGGAYAPWLVVDNPNATGLADRYVIAPPSGFVAGLIAATDDKAGGGVHKAPANEQLGAVAGLSCMIGDKDQGPLNTRGINIIRPRPNAGIRVWGARTTAADPLWRYINVRRLFLMVERSIQDAVQWAVFLPNTDQTRGDLRSTIAAFLFRLYREGALDGATPDEAYKVQCDRANNSDADVRAGILTVDVELRPPFPAEFIRLRFRQAPMQVEG